MQYDRCTLPTKPCPYLGNRSWIIERLFILTFLAEIMYNDVVD